MRNLLVLCEPVAFADCKELREFEQVEDFPAGGFECKTHFAPQRASGNMGSWNFALPKLSNLKDGHIMGSRKLTPQELDRITELARSWGKVVARRAFGEHGPGLDVDLAQMEAVAVAAARGLTAGAMEAATRQQAEHLGAAQPCPQCGRSCPVATEERPVEVEGGAFQHGEPKCHCPTCRRDFFPSAAAAETRRPRLQPGDSAQDRRRGGAGEVV
jgi:hypothetical protein